MRTVRRVWVVWTVWTVWALVAVAGKEAAPSATIDLDPVKITLQDMISEEDIQAAYDAQQAVDTRNDSAVVLLVRVFCLVNASIK